MYRYKLRAWGKRDTILGQYCGSGHAPQILGIFEIAKIFTKNEQLSSKITWINIIKYLQKVKWNSKGWEPWSVGNTDKTYKM